jgi:hypothetical protein
MGKETGKPFGATCGPVLFSLVAASPICRFSIVQSSHCIDQIMQASYKDNGPL